MTKQIRVENADNSNHRVAVFVEQKDATGTWIRVRILHLDFPTSMGSEYIHDNQRLVIEEVE